MNAVGLKFQKSLPDTLPNVVSQKSLYIDCHSRLDQESSLSELDSRFRRNDGFRIIVKKC
jgi:hypothetical protein